MLGYWRADEGDRPLMARWFSESRRLSLDQTRSTKTSPRNPVISVCPTIWQIASRALPRRRIIRERDRGMADPSFLRLLYRRPVIIQKRDISLPQFLLVTESPAFSLASYLLLASPWAASDTYRDNDKALAPTGFREESCNKLYPRIDTCIGL